MEEVDNSGSQMSEPKDVNDAKSRESCFPLVNKKLKKEYVMPQGLTGLINELSNQVIWHKPKNISLFLADYLERKLEAGEGPATSDGSGPGGGGAHKKTVVISETVKTENEIVDGGIAEPEIGQGSAAVSSRVGKDTRVEEDSSKIESTTESGPMSPAESTQNEARPSELHYPNEAESPRGSETESTESSAEPSMILEPSTDLDEEIFRESSAVTGFKTPPSASSIAFVEDSNLPETPSGAELSVSNPSSSVGAESTVSISPVSSHHWPTISEPETRSKSNVHKDTPRPSLEEDATSSGMGGKQDEGSSGSTKSGNESTESSAEPSMLFEPNADIEDNIIRESSDVTGFKNPPSASSIAFVDESNLPETPSGAELSVSTPASSSAGGGSAVSISPMSSHHDRRPSQEPSSMAYPSKKESPSKSENESTESSAEPSMLFEPSAEIEEDIIRESSDVTGFKKPPSASSIAFVDESNLPETPSGAELSMSTPASSTEGSSVSISPMSSHHDRRPSQEPRSLDYPSEKESPPKSESESTESSAEPSMILEPSTDLDEEIFRESSAVTGFKKPPSASSIAFVDESNLPETPSGAESVSTRTSTSLAGSGSNVSISPVSSHHDRKPDQAQEDEQPENLSPLIAPVHLSKRGKPSKGVSEAPEKIPKEAEPSGSNIDYHSGKESPQKSKSESTESSAEPSMLFEASTEVEEEIIRESSDVTGFKNPPSASSIAFVDDSNLPETPSGAELSVSTPASSDAGSDVSISPMSSHHDRRPSQEPSNLDYPSEKESPQKSESESTESSTEPSMLFESSANVQEDIFRESSAVTGFKTPPSASSIAFVDDSNLPETQSGAELSVSTPASSGTGSAVSISPVSSHHDASRRPSTPSASFLPSTEQEDVDALAERDEEMSPLDSEPTTPSTFQSSSHMGSAFSDFSNAILPEDHELSPKGSAIPSKSNVKSSSKMEPPTKASPSALDYPSEKESPPKSESESIESSTEPSMILEPSADLDEEIFRESSAVTGFKKPPSASSITFVDESNLPETPSGAESVSTRTSTSLEGSGSAVSISPVSSHHDRKPDQEEEEEPPSMLFEASEAVEDEIIRESSDVTGFKTPPSPSSIADESNFPETPSGAELSASTPASNSAAGSDVSISPMSSHHDAPRPSIEDSFPEQLSNAIADLPHSSDQIQERKTPGGETISKAASSISPESDHHAQKHPSTSPKTIESKKPLETSSAMPSHPGKSSVLPQDSSSIAPKASQSLIPSGSSQKEPGHESSTLQKLPKPRQEPSPSTIEASRLSRPRFGPSEDSKVPEKLGSELPKGDSQEPGSLKFSPSTTTREFGVPDSTGSETFSKAESFESEAPSVLVEPSIEVETEIIHESSTFTGFKSPPSSSSIQFSDKSNLPDTPSGAESVASPTSNSLAGSSISISPTSSHHDAPTSSIAKPSKLEKMPSSAQRERLPPTSSGTEKPAKGSNRPGTPTSSSRLPIPQSNITGTLSKTKSVSSPTPSSAVGSSVSTSQVPSRHTSKIPKKTKSYEIPKDKTVELGVFPSSTVEKLPSTPSGVKEPGQKSKKPGDQITPSSSSHIQSQQPGERRSTSEVPSTSGPISPQKSGQPKDHGPIPSVSSPIRIVESGHQRVSTQSSRAESVTRTESTTVPSQAPIGGFDQPEAKPVHATKKSIPLSSLSVPSVPTHGSSSEHPRDIKQLPSKVPFAPSNAPEHVREPSPTPDKSKHHKTPTPTPSSTGAGTDKHVSKIEMTPTPSGGPSSLKPEHLKGKPVSPIPSSTLPPTPSHIEKHSKKVKSVSAETQVSQARIEHPMQNVPSTHTKDKITGKSVETQISSVALSVSTPHTDTPESGPRTLYERYRVPIIGFSVFTGVVLLVYVLEKAEVRTTCVRIVEKVKEAIYPTCAPE